MDLLLDQGQLTDQDIREEVDTFLFEGYDTSSVATTITLILLGIYQNIQVKLKFLCSVVFMYSFKYNTTLISMDISNQLPYKV